MKYCFVYGLYESSSEEPFYIGKGSGYRDTSHLKPSAWKDPIHSTNPFLYFKIKSLMELGKTIVIKRISTGLTNEEAMH